MKKANIVMFWFMNDWGLYGRAYEQIAKTLAENISVNHVTCILPPIKADNNSYFFKKEIVSKNLSILTPYWQTINSTGKFYQIRHFINQHLSSLKSINFYLKLLGYKKNNTILWLFPTHHFLHKLVLTIPYHYLVTQIVDNKTMRDISNNEADLISQNYSYFSKLADLTITSSQANFDIFNTQSNHCCLIENGVSSNFFHEPSALPHKTHTTRPRLGYVGFISLRTDVDLMYAIAKKCADCDLIIAGPDEGVLNNSEILELNNVYYLGSCPQSDVPALIKSFDICLIPHKITSYSNSMSPLKLYQYLASGRPIISTRVAGTKRFSHLISLVDSVDSFINAIYQTLESDDVNKGIARVQAARNEMWESKIELMLQQINKTINIANP